MRTRRLALLIGSATLALAACGGDPDPVTDGPTTTARATATSPSAPVTNPADPGWLTSEPGTGLPACDPPGRIVVRVSGSDGLPVAGAEVRVVAADADDAADPAVLASVRTAADGTARFHPALYDV